MADMLEFSASLAQMSVVIDEADTIPGLPFGILSTLRTKGLLPPDGVQLFVEDDGTVDEVLLQFLLDIQTDGVSSLRSIHGYAQDLRVLKRYLRQALGKGLLDCTVGDFRQFKRRRTSGDCAVSAVTWNRILAACERFYGWAEERGRIAEKPFRYRAERIDRPNVSRNAFAERRVDNGIKCVTLADYEFFRDVGLRGHQPDKTVDAGFCGRFPLRNAAFAEFLVTSGARLQEAAFALTHELPPPMALKDPRRLTLPLASALSKNGQRRALGLSRRVFERFLLPYMREERQLVLQQRAGKYVKACRAGDGGEPMIVIEPSRNGDGTVVVVEGGQVRKLDRIDGSMRRRLIQRTLNGQLEPLALWIGEQGLCLTLSAWEKVFAEARRRCAAYGRPLDIHPHTLRHTFAVQMLSFLVKATLGTLVEFRREHHRNPVLMQKIMMDPLRELQRLMGHRNLETTYVYLTYVTEASDLVDEAMAEWDRAFGADRLDRGV